MFELSQQISKIAAEFAPRGKLTAPDEIRQQLEADIVAAQKFHGYVDQSHQLHNGWTRDQLSRHFVPIVNDMARRGLIHAPDVQVFAGHGVLAGAR